MHADMIKFSGRVVSIAEEEFGACAGNELLKQLFDGWQKDDSPCDRDHWIRGKLTNIFVSADKKPEWPRDVQDWPEHEGKPMVFLGQLHVPAFDFPEGYKSCDCIMFLFGAPEGSPAEWRMITKTVHLFESFKGARITKVIKGPDEL